MMFQLLLARRHAELKIILVVLVVLIGLPTLAVAVVATSGVAAVSRALAAVNPQTQAITLYDAAGAARTTLQLPTIWPTRGVVSSEFGATESLRAELGLGPHTGIDIANAHGVPVYAFADGTVVRTDTRGAGTCGRYVELMHVGGITSLYCHLQSVDVDPGTALKLGQPIGSMGSTGASTGPHLHFQINVNNIPVNPRTFVSGEPPGATRGP